MRRRALATLLAVSFTLLSATIAEAHDQTKILVDPASATAGDPVTLSVSGVEPNQQRVIVLIGQGIVVPFPTVKTDGTGSFSVQVTIPSRLPGGTYRFEAIGDETLTGEVNIMAVAGGIAAQPAPEQAVPEARSRSGLEAALILAGIIVAAIAGVALVVGAERTGASRTA